MKVLKYSEYLFESTKSTANILKLRDMIISDISKDFIKTGKLNNIILIDYAIFFDNETFRGFLNKKHEIIFEYKSNGLAFYDTYKTKNIYLLYREAEMKMLIDSLNLKMYDYISSDINDLFGSDIAHELQHAYDDYLSKYTLFNNKKNTNYFKNQKRLDDISPKLTDYGYDTENHKLRNQYFNLQAEIDARFTQFVDKYNFYNENGDTKKQFDDVLKDFKISDTIKYDKIIKERKPKLLKKLYDYWLNFKKEDIS